MYILFILFFTSLLGILLMIGRKLLVLENVGELEKRELPFRMGHMEEMRIIGRDMIKSYGYAVLVLILKLYIKTLNLGRYAYERSKGEIKINVDKWNKKRQDAMGDKRESKFLKMIGEYKEKIREIKHKIIEEEAKIK